MDHILVIEELRAGYNNVEVLHGVSLKVKKGEKLVIIGPSGSGKSTLLRTIPRLVEPTSGKIVFEGIEVHKLKKDELRRVRSRIGFLPQSYGLFLHMKVIDNIVLPLVKVKGLSREEAERRAFKYLKMLGIEDLAYRYPSQLSGGQQQRAAIARAMAMEPSLLLLDEPTSALDPESRADVLDALYKIAQGGNSMILVTHEVDFALEVADRMAFMEEGRILSIGYVDEVLSNERLRRFLRSIKI